MTHIVKTATEDRVQDTVGLRDSRWAYRWMVVSLIVFSQPLLFLQNRMVHLVIPLAIALMVFSAKEPNRSGKLKVSLLVVALIVLSASSLFWTVSLRSSALELTVLLSTVICGVVVGNSLTIGSICRALVSAGLIILFVSVVIAVLVPSYGLQLGDYQAGSLRGIYSHRNVLAFTLIVAFVGVLGMSTDNPKARIAIVILLTAGIVSANSSTAIVCGVLALVVWIILKFFSNFGREYRIVPVILTVPALSLLSLLVYSKWTDVLLLLGRDATFTGRTYIWHAVEQVSGREPVFGYGWGGVWGGSWVEKYVNGLAGFRVPHAHSGYLDLRVQLGFVGLALVIFILLSLLFNGSRAYFQSDESAYILVPILVVVFAVYNIVETRITLPLSLFLLVVLSSHLLAAKPLSKGASWGLR